MKKRALELSISNEYSLVVRSSNHEFIKESIDDARQVRAGIRVYENPESQIVGIYEHPRHFEPLLTLASCLQKKELIDECFVGTKLMTYAAKDTGEMDSTFNFVAIKQTNANMPNVNRLTDDLGKAEILRLLGDIIVFIYPSNKWQRIEAQLRKLEAHDRLLGLSLVHSEKPTAPSKRQYHPIVARLSELGNRIAYLRNSCEKLLYASQGFQSRHQGHQAAKYIEDNVERVLTALRYVELEIRTVGVIQSAPASFQQPRNLDYFTAEAFLKFPELPMLESENVVVNALVQGVREGSLGLLINERIRYIETVFTSDISEEALVVRKEIAQKMQQEIQKGPITIEEKPSPEVPGAKPVAEKEIIKRILLRADVPWDKLSELVRGVFTPLSREGAQIALEVKIEARSEQGISKDTLDMKIKETLKQIGANVLEEKEE